jgi:hypothetical protein
MLSAVFCAVPMMLMGLHHAVVRFHAPGIDPAEVMPFTEILGVPITAFWTILFFVIPWSLVLFVFLTGAWRMTVILFWLLFVCMLVFQGDSWWSVAEKNRYIQFNAPHDTEIFCNDVSLGTKYSLDVSSPILVSNLVQKVPKWNTPPKQQWYIDDEQPVYTQIPCDLFLRERYDERRGLDPAKGFASFDAKSQYWWRFERNGQTAISSGASDEPKMYSERQVLFIPPNGLFFPARQPLLDLLLQILKDDDYKPSPEWIDYVNKDYLVHLNLFFNDENLLLDPRLEPALEELARYHFKLSDHPTMEEWNRFYEQCKNEWVGRQGAVLVHRLKQIGTADTELLLKKLRSPLFDTAELGALILMVQVNHSPELFQAMVEVFAANSDDQQILTAVMSLQDERVIPLFRTYLGQPQNIFDDPISHASRKMEQIVDIKNPLLEPIIREYFARRLPKALEQGMGHRYSSGHEKLLVTLVRNRLDSDWIDKNELHHWVESLNIAGRDKSNALQLIQNASFKRVKYECEMLKTKSGEKFDIEKLRAWLRNHPDKPVDELIDTFVPHDDILNFFRGVKHSFLRDLTIHDFTEAEDLARRLWKEPADRGIVMGTAGGLFTQSPLLEFSDRNPFLFYQSVQQGERHRIDLPGRSQVFQIPGSYQSVIRSQDGKLDSTPSNRLKSLPNYFVSIFSELTEAQECIVPATILKYSESSEAVTLLERWQGSENVQLKQTAEKSLSMIKSRVYLHENRRRIFNDLVSGKMTPDDILPKPEAFVWEEEKYVVRE